MDVPRSNSRTAKSKRLVITGAVVVVVALAGLGISTMTRAVPVISRSSLWLEKVTQGPMTRQVRGTGTLVPEEVYWIPAATQGRVDRILIRPGVVVAPDSVILELSNPELE